MECDDCRLALLGNNGDLALTMPYVKDSVRRISLGEYNFIFSIFGYGPSRTLSEQEDFRVEASLSVWIYDSVPKQTDA